MSSPKHSVAGPVMREAEETQDTQETEKQRSERQRDSEEDELSEARARMEAQIRDVQLLLEQRREKRCAMRTTRDMVLLLETTFGLSNHIRHAVHAMYDGFHEQGRCDVYELVDNMGAAAFDAFNELHLILDAEKKARAEHKTLIYGFEGLTDKPRHIDYFAELVMWSLPKTWGDFSQSSLLKQLTLVVGGSTYRVRDALLFVRWMRWPGRGRERPVGAGPVAAEHSTVRPALVRIGAKATVATMVRRAQTPSPSAQNPKLPSGTAYDADPAMTMCVSSLGTAPYSPIFKHAHSILGPPKHGDADKDDEGHKGHEDAAHHDACADACSMAGSIATRV